MRTRIALWLLLSAAAGAALAQSGPPAEAWRVAPEEQRERDVVRKGILENELASEARQFLDAYAEVGKARAAGRVADRVREAGERVAQHRENLQALAREIARIERPEDTIASNGNTAAPRPRERAASSWLIRGRRSETKTEMSQGPVARREQTATRQPDWIFPGTPFGGMP